VSLESKTFIQIPGFLIFFKCYLLVTIHIKLSKKTFNQFTAIQLYNVEAWTLCSL